MSGLKGKNRNFTDYTDQIIGDFKILGFKGYDHCGRYIVEAKCIHCDCDKTFIAPIYVFKRRKVKGKCHHPNLKKDYLTIHPTNWSLLLSDFKYGAIYRGISFDEENLTIDYLKQLLKDQDEICAGTGKKMITVGGGRGYGNLSLDRIDNSKGYEVGNVQFVTFRFNKIKSDKTMSEVFKEALDIVIYQCKRSFKKFKYALKKFKKLCIIRRNNHSTCEVT